MESTMGMTKRKYLILITILLSVTVLIIVMFSVINIFDRNNRHETSDIEFYYQRSSNQNLQLLLFPQNIPDNATSIYHYYNYYSTYDEYLELSFCSADELQIFVDSTLQAVENCGLTERKNPYNEKYIEYFCTSVHATSYKNQYKQEYNYIEYYNNSHIGAFFYSMNVSTDELKVIISYFNGKFETKSYIPMYLRYFNIPLNEELCDYVEFENNPYNDKK